MSGHPSLGQTLTWVEELLPGTTVTLEGANEDEIATLEQVIAKPLPADYREFLRLAGRSMGRLNMFDFDTNIVAVRHFHKKPRWEVPERFILIGRQDVDLYLELTSNASTGYRVHTFLPEEIEAPDLASHPDRHRAWAESIQEFVFSAAFRTYLKQRFASLSRYANIIVTPKPPSRDDIRCLLAKLGFTRHPARWTWHEQWHKASAACDLFSHGTGGILYVGAKTDLELQAIGKHLITKLGLRRMGFD